jgi:hypothetical protein
MPLEMLVGPHQDWVCRQAPKMGFAAFAASTRPYAETEGSRLANLPGPWLQALSPVRGGEAHQKTRAQTLLNRPAAFCLGPREFGNLAVSTL